MSDRVASQPYVAPDTGQETPAEAGGVFREKSFQPEESKIEPPISAYEYLKGEPYTVKYFGLNDWLVFMKNPQFDVDNLKGQVDRVEQYIIKKVQHERLIDSPESYRAIMQNLKTKLKISPLERGDSAFKKILGYINRVDRKSAYGL